MTEGQDHSL